jgi:hypothetical protein
VLKAESSSGASGVVFVVRALLRRRPTQVAVMIAALLAGWTASAAAGLPPLPPPPITVPSLTIPTVTVPPVTTPSVTTPPVPQPPQAPPVPTVPGVTLPSARPPAPQAGGGGSSSGGGGSGAPASAGARGAGAGAQSSGGASQSRRTGARPTRVYRLRLARDWISRSGPNKQRRTTLVFVLRRRTVVELVVIRVAPNCRRIGRFRVQGHRGVNRVRLGSRVGRHSLSPGTYRIVARTLPGGRTISDTRLVVVERASRGEIRAARGADACPRAAASGSVSTATGTPAGSRPGAAEPDKRAQPSRHRGVLGEKFARRAISAARDVPLWLYLLLTLAIVLLAAAALFPKAAPAGLAASLVFGATGATVLLLATLAYALL